MLKLRATLESELEQIVALEHDPNLKGMVTPHSLDDHKSDFVADDFTYLMIEYEGKFAGFIILIEEPDNNVMCLRIAVSIREQGIGQQALKLMEDYCKTTFNAKRIWLDVSATNPRAIHVYTKLGYQQFDQKTEDGKDWLYMEKYI